MMNQDDFSHLIRDIQKLGFDEQTAGDYAVAIGDTPELDDQGLVVVRSDDGSVLARLALNLGF